MHGITKCSKCDTVISQCRCIDHKEVRYVVCDACKEKFKKNIDELEIKITVEKVVRLVHQFDDGELSYQGLDNELHNLYAE